MELLWHVGLDSAAYSEWRVEKGTILHQASQGWRLGHHSLFIQDIHKLCFIAACVGLCKVARQQSCCPIAFSE